MGRKKGTVTKYYEKELKIKLINEALDNGINLTARKYNISQGMLCNWIKSYEANNNTIVNNKYKRGNPLSKYANRKNLTDMEKLQYENMKLRIENERLKKGYKVEGVGTIVVFKK